MIEAELIVVGAGPTGLAALAEARRRGIDALGLDAGRPLEGLRRFMDGLPLVSPSFCFEIGGLPLDCRDPTHPTKEELIHYYARVLHGGLRVVPNKKVTAIRTGEFVELAFGEETARCRNLIFTAWYDRRPVPPSTAGVHVFDGFASAADLLGRRTVVVGGGVSAVEHAAAVMLNGQPVTMLIRGPRRFIIGREPFQRLVRATGSELIEEVEDVRVEDHGVRYQVRGESRVVACEAAVYCIGAELSRRALALLADVLPESLACALLETPSFEALARSRPELSEDDAFRMSNRVRPDLYEYVFHGVRGVRFAGGVLHSGASNSEIASSIQSAELAVRAIAGDALPIERPLPIALLRLANGLGPRVYRFEDVAKIRPLPIGGWTRHAISLAPPGHRRSPDDPHAIEHLFTGRHTMTEIERELLDRADGETSVEEIAREGEVESAREKELFMIVLSHLFRANVLTWLPPRCP